MKHIKNLVPITLMATALIFTLPPSQGEAGRYKLKCKGPYQIVQGSHIATPPCQDRYIARIARSYGYKVTARKLQRNPNLKVSICQILGHDTRIGDHCPYKYKPSLRGHR